MSTKRIKTYMTYRLDGTIKAYSNCKRWNGRFMEKQKTAQRMYHEYHQRESV